MSDVRTKDLYEAAYYLAQGCRIRDLEFTGRPGRHEHEFVFDEKEAGPLAPAYLSGDAVVNLFDFRRGYNEAWRRLRSARKAQGVIR